MTHMFGNPGTVEQGFLDSLGSYPDFEYILSLQETVAVGMADGYARATRRPTAVQLHSGVGLGNGIGMLYQAKRGHAPLVVLTGESGLRYDSMEAEVWGAEVWGADWSEVNMNHAHPQFRGMLGHMFGDHSRSITSQADAVLICGTYVFPEVFPSLAPVFAAGAPVVHIDLNAHEIAKNFPVDVGLVADPKLTLGAVADALARTMSPGQAAEASARARATGASKQADLDSQRSRDRSFHDSLPMHASLFAEELARQLPPDAIVFDEALTTSP